MNNPHTQRGPHDPATFATYNTGVRRAVANYRSRCKVCRIRAADPVSPKCSSCWTEEAGRCAA